MPGKAARVIITERQQEILQAMTRESTCPQGLVQRAGMILDAFEGFSNEAIADRLGYERHAVGIWRRRWADAFESLVLVECCEGPTALRRAIDALLNDEPRSGSWGKFTPEQVTQILAVACEDPQECGRPVTHWSARELADEVKQRGIVASISPRQVGRFLKYGRTPAASQPLLAQRQTRRSGGLPAPGRSGVCLLPGGSRTPESRGYPYRQRG